MKTLGLFIVNVLSSIAKAVVAGFVLMCCWGWFVNPIFPAAPILTIGTAMGLMLVFDFFLTNVSASLLDINADTDLGELFVKGIVQDICVIVVACPVTFVFGSVLHQFVR